MDVSVFVLFGIIMSCFCNPKVKNNNNTSTALAFHCVWLICTDCYWQLLDTLGDKEVANTGKRNEMFS
ncbi:hypothetical protein XELAEV_18007902mg [Xenopus laevis]|uniref:Uncharacterized protein n=1 Tax=Xenopus laevis TaxID=8355 RepID=A0A974I5I8_XENLA|nr:hypothetical protein XELAEV_18007902mg [Xenopus laevis]